MRKHIILLAIVTVSVLLLVMVLDTSDEENAIATISEYKKDLNPPEESGPGIDYTGLYYNEAHMKAMQIDFTKLPSPEILNIPESLYSGKVNNAKDRVDLEGDIRTYALLCEILANESINPPDSDVFIRPYHLYGSWYNEIGYKKKDTLGFNPIFDVIETAPNALYLGPFSLHKSYKEGTTTDDKAPRMYIYISHEENQELNDASRALRISPNEFQKGIANIAVKGVNNGSLTLTTEAEKASYISEFEKNLTIAKDARPDPNYLPDAAFTFARKLRSNYQDLNSSTLVESDLTSWESTDALYEQYVTTEGDFKSDIYFLGSVYKNSAELRPHQASTVKGYPTKETNYVNAMPMFYMEMIEQYGSLDIREIGLFSGWSEINTSHRKFFGTAFSTPMYSAPIQSKDNLIDRIDSVGPKVLAKESLRSFMTKVHKYAYQRSQEDYGSAELEWSLYYPLRCITNGKMIQQGVEAMINQVYEIQKENGQLIGQEWEDSGESDSEDGDYPDDDWGDRPTGTLTDSDIVNPSELKRRQRLTPEEFPSGTILPHGKYRTLTTADVRFPLALGSTGKYKVTHGYWCGPIDNPFSYYGCAKSHGAYGQHIAIDFVHHKLNSKNNAYSATTCDILAFADGVVVKKSADGPYGTRVVISHVVKGITFYTNYGHMQKDSTKHLSLGVPVYAGDKIGHMGTTGNSTGNHLHFALYTGAIDERNREATAYDPMLLVPYMQKGG